MRYGSTAINLRWSSGTVADTYGTPIDDANWYNDKVAVSFRITVDDVAKLIAQQLLGQKPNDIVAGTLQFSITRINVWAEDNMTETAASWVYVSPNFPRLTARDEDGKNSKARVGLRPPPLWFMDNTTNATLAVIVIGELDSTKLPTPKVKVGVMRIAVQYQVLNTATT